MPRWRATPRVRIYIAVIEPDSVQRLAGSAPQSSLLLTKAMPLELLQLFELFELFYVLTDSLSAGTFFS